MTENDFAIDLRGFSKRYNREIAVHNLDLQVKNGTFFGFVGPNGAGKSTTINAMVGMIRPSAGTIKVAGFDIARQPLEVKSRVGFMPEETVLYERMTAREYLRFAGTMYGLDDSLISERTEELLKLLDLSGDKYMGTYSLGMKKKAALASAIIHRPQVIILDEPFSGIDATTASRIRKSLIVMVEQGHTVFFSSHVLETVERISSEIGIINKGKLLSKGTFDQIREDAGCKPGTSLEDVFLILVGACNAEDLGCDNSDI